MCTGGRLLADFVAGTDVQPALPAELGEHLTTTVDGSWVVWAHKLARQAGDLFVPLTGGPGYPADATAKCRARGTRRGHNAPNPRCTCGFHALSRPTLPGLLPSRAGFAALTVALSGRVLAFEWAGGGVLWRAERQTVVRIELPRFDPMEELLESARAISRLRPVLSYPKRGQPGDPGGRPALVRPLAPRDSGPVRLNLPVSAPALPVSHDDVGWCVAADPLDRSPASLVLTDRELVSRRRGEQRNAPALV